jgi:EmrB/QacA subfamily drug resistance transporter
VSARRRKTLTLVATILGSTVVFLDATVVNVALPALESDLDTGLAAQQWVVEAYLLALVSLLLVGGSLGDQFGRRLMFMVGLVGFAITSAMCALAPSSGFLIAARGLQGMAGALLVPGSLAIVAATYKGAARGKAIGTWTAWTGISTVLGPAGGGLLVDTFSWRAVFWVNLPLIAATLAMTLHSVSESKDPKASHTIDWLGIFLSAAGLGAPVFALIEQPTHGWGSPIVWAPLILGIVLFAGFIYWEMRAKHPMVDLKLFRIRNFTVANMATLFTYAGLLAAFFFITLFLQQTAGYSALEAGLATTPISILLFALSPRFGRITSASGPRLPMACGPIVAGFGLLFLIRVGANPDYFTEVLPGLILFGLGLSATVAPLTATVLDSVPQRRTGIASGINNGVARVAGLLAIAVLGAVISAQFASSIDKRLMNVHLGAAGRAAVEEAQSRALGGADLAGVPARERRALEPAITGASESAFHLGLFMASLLMISGGCVSAVGIRNPRRRRAVPITTAVAAGECARHDGRPRRVEKEPASA